MYWMGQFTGFPLTWESTQGRYKGTSPKLAVHAGTKKPSLNGFAFFDASFGLGPRLYFGVQKLLGHLSSGMG
jgi:hypothetical protein